MMGETGSISSESAGQQARDADERRRLASDMQRYAGWLSKNHVSAAVRAGVAELGVAMDRGRDASLELITLGTDIGRLPSGDVRTMLKKTLKKLQAALPIAEAM